MQPAYVRLQTSFGGMLTILSYLPEMQQTFIQQISKYWYKTGVSRIQVRFSLLRIDQFK